MSSFKTLAMVGMFSFAITGAAAAQAIAVNAAKNEVMAAVPAGSQVVTSVVQRPNGRPVYAFEIREPNDPATHMVYVDTATGKIMAAEALGLPSTGVHSAAYRTSTKEQSTRRKIEKCEAKHPDQKERCREKYRSR